MTIDKKNISKENDKPELVSIDFPTWVIEKLDEKAHFMGVSSQDLIKLWVVERLDTYCDSTMTKNAIMNG